MEQLETKENKKNLTKQLEKAELLLQGIKRDCNATFREIHISA